MTVKKNKPENERLKTTEERMNNSFLSIELNKIITNLYKHQYSLFTVHCSRSIPWPPND